MMQRLTPTTLFFVSLVFIPPWPRGAPYCGRYCSKLLIEYLVESLPNHDFERLKVIIWPEWEKAYTTER